jgi:hypothetical protein
MYVIPSHSRLRRPIITPCTVLCELSDPGGHVCVPFRYVIKTNVQITYYHSTLLPFRSCFVSGLQRATARVTSKNKGLFLVSQGPATKLNTD